MDLFALLAELFPEASSKVVLGAVTGAVLFTVTSKDFSTGKKLVLFAVSFVVGCFGAGLAGSFVAAIVPVDLDPVIGGFIAGAACVPAMMALFARLEREKTPHPKRSRHYDDLSPDFPYSPRDEARDDHGGPFE